MTTAPLPDSIHTQADLEHLWCALMGPLGFSRASLWLVLVEADGTPIPQVSQIDELPARPEPRLLDNLFGTLAGILTGMPRGSRVALLRSRPGPGVVTPDDVAWAAAIGTAARAAGVPCEPVHLATDERVAVVAYDDLPGTV